MAGVVTLTAVAVYPILGQSHLPSFQERDCLMHRVARPGTSLPEMQRIACKASDALMTIPGMLNFGAHIGQAYLMDEVVGVEFAENWTRIPPVVADKTTLAAVQETVKGYPGLCQDLQTYLRERIKEVLTGSSGSSVVRIYGPELGTLRSVAEVVEVAMRSVGGLQNLHVILLAEIPQGARRGRSLQGSELRAETGRHAPGCRDVDGRRRGRRLLRNGRAHDVVVWSQPETRASLGDCRRLLVETPSGKRVELGELADIPIIPAPNGVVRRYATRKLNVGANIAEGGDPGRALAGVDAAVQKSRVSARLRGRGAWRGRRTQGGANAAGAILDRRGGDHFRAAGDVVRRTVLAGLIFVTLPMALVGGLIAPQQGDGVMSPGSLVGYRSVLGVAASGLALLPMVIAGHRPGNGIEHPTAVVILGGSVMSTLLNLFVVRSLYPVFGRRVALPAPVDTTPQEATAEHRLQHGVKQKGRKSPAWDRWEPI